MFSKLKKMQGHHVILQKTDVKIFNVSLIYVCYGSEKENIVSIL